MQRQLYSLCQRQLYSLCQGLKSKIASHVMMVQVRAAGAVRALPGALRQRHARCHRQPPPRPRALLQGACAARAPCPQFNQLPLMALTKACCGHTLHHALLLTLYRLPKCNNLSCHDPACRWAAYCGDQWAAEAGILGRDLTAATVFCNDFVPLVWPANYTLAASHTVVICLGSSWLNSDRLPLFCDVIM